MLRVFSTKRLERGFTLVEVLIAIMILAIGIVGVMAALPTSYRGITRAGRVSTITHLGYRKIDQLKITSRLNWTDASVTNGSHPATAAARMVGGNFTGYSITWQITNDSPETGMKRLVVEVGYKVYDDSGNLITPVNHNMIKQKFQTFLSQ